MPDDAHSQTPLGTGWSLIDQGPFEILTGPLFRTTLDLPPDEPLRIGFRVGPQHCNFNGPCHGGMISTFLDMALGLSMFEATKALPNSPTMTLTVDFLGAAMAGDWIESRTRVLQATYRTAFCDATAVGPNGLVARANGIFKLTRPK